MYITIWCAMNRVFKSILMRFLLFQIGFIVAVLSIAVAYARGAFSPRALGIVLICLVATSAFVLIRFVFRWTTQPEAVPVTGTSSSQHKIPTVRFLKGVIVFLVLALAAGLWNFPRNGPVLPLLVGIGVNVSFIIVTYLLLRRIRQQ
jgi:hypothetical protein